MSEKEKINIEQKYSYRGIFKATSLFGGVQVYQILIEVIKSKFIAVLLGPEGVGIQGLYTSGITLIQQLTSFGLSSSAIRNVAESHSQGDIDKIAKVVSALRKLVYITGFLGMIAVIALSPLLSKTSFGDNVHIIGFIVISVTLLFNQISAGQKVILQGTRNLKLLAKSSAIGVTLGLFFSIPLYYWYGIDGVVPNIIITAMTSLALTYYFSRKVLITKISISAKETFSIGRSMLSMGIAMSLSQLVAAASGYTLRGCIRMWGGVDEVGLFTAGFLLMTQYTGLVFSAMGTDFYPRLAAVNKDNAKCKQLMNQQGEIGLLIISPLLSLCIVFIPIVVVILYSEKFLSIDSYIVWCSVGMLFKMASWTVSYIFIAKGESKLFAFNELSVGIYSLLLSLLGYKIGGLQGLGISFALSYLLYMIQVYTIAKRKYLFTFSSSIIRIFLVQLCLISVCVLCVFLLPEHWKYIYGSIILIASTLYSIRELNNRIDLRSIIRNKMNNNGK